jgi:hypothetical protein
MKPVSQIIVFLGLTVALAQPAKAPLTYVRSGQIHCSNGRSFPAPTEHGPSVGLDESRSTEIAATSQQSQYEDARKRCLEDDENEQVLAGKKGDWAAFWAAWEQGRSKVYFYILGKWSVYLTAFILVLYAVLGRKGR